MNTHIDNAQNISDKFRDILIHLGEDPQRDGLKRTPERFALSLDFLMSGMRTEQEVVADCKKAIFDEDVRSAVAIKDIEFYSLCEHHILPFWGSVSIAFIPNKNGKILGLSKFGRLVDVYSRRLQVQERLGAQVLDIISEILEPQAICVRTEAKHLCMMMRGVEKHASTTVTYEFRGDDRFEQNLKDLIR